MIRMHNPTTQALAARFIEIAREPGLAVLKTVTWSRGWGLVMLPAGVESPMLPDFKGFRIMASIHVGDEMSPKDRESYLDDIESWNRRRIMTHATASVGEAETFVRWFILGTHSGY